MHSVKGWLARGAFGRSGGLLAGYLLSTGGFIFKGGGTLLLRLASTFFFFVLGVSVTVLLCFVSAVIYFLSCPISAFSFLVFAATFFRTTSSNSSLSIEISMSRRFLVASVTFSSVLVVSSFLRDKYISISSMRAK